jgi:hypothetical protein
MKNLKGFNPRPIPLGFGDRFPDGSYTVGRGADPRTSSGRTGDLVPALVDDLKKPRKPAAKKRPRRPAAE